MKESPMFIRLALVFVLALGCANVAVAQTAQQEIERFVDFYGAELTRTGFAPDASSTRETRITFLQQTVKRFCSPLLSMKRADPGRPISDEVVVFLHFVDDQPGPEHRTFADFLISGGSSGWKLSKHLEGKLERAQPLVNPLTLGVLPEGVLAPTAPGCSSPLPGPKPTPPPPPAPVYPGYPSNEGILDATGAALFDDFAAAGQAPNPQMFRFAFRVAYDWLVGNVPTLEAAKAKHQKEWRALLGLPPQ